MTVFFRSEGAPEESFLFLLEKKGMFVGRRMMNEEVCLLGEIIGEKEKPTRWRTCGGFEKHSYI